MARVSNAKVLEFAENVQKMLEQEKPYLRKSGFDVNLAVSRLKHLHAEVLSSEARTDALRRELKANSLLWSSLRNQLFVSSYGDLETAYSAVEKHSAPWRNFGRLRNQWGKPAKGNGSRTAKAKARARSA